MNNFPLHKGDHKNLRVFCQGVTDKNSPYTWWDMQFGEKIKRKAGREINPSRVYKYMGGFTIEVDSEGLAWCLTYVLLSLLILNWGLRYSLKKG